MSGLSVRFRAVLNRQKLAEMFASVQAAARIIDLEEAYDRVELALADPQLVDGFQRGIWAALCAARPDQNEGQLIEGLTRKIDKRKVYKPPSRSRKNEGAWAAVAIAIDRGAGVSSGEAADLLDSPEGQAMLARGFRAAGDHIVKQLFGAS